MRHLTHIIFFLLFVSYYIFGQSNWGNQVNIDNYSISTKTNLLEPENIEGTWEENTNMSMKLTVNVESGIVPYELGFYLGQQTLEYWTPVTGGFIKIDVRYDNGNWITLKEGSYTTGTFTPPFNTLGEHTMDFRYWYIDAKLHELNHKIYVVPGRDKIYYDGLGNWVSGWTGTTTSLDRPVIIIEGFDAVNTTSPAYYYGKSSNWLNRIRDLDADVLIFNFNDGGADLVANAHIIQGFVRYIESISQGTEKIILAGLSMGGTIGRYALSEAEAQEIPLYVSHFLSIDSPQQDAIIPRDFLKYIKEHDDNVPHPSLNCTAAKQILRYNPYDPDSPYDPNDNNSNSIHTRFFNVLNRLNGDGYPHDCINIGVSFAPNINNPNIGEWLEVKIDFIPNKHFYLWEDNECLAPGSYLPLSSTIAQGSVFLARWFLDRKLKENGEYKNPTYIPYISSLDIVNGESKFDITLNSSYINYHDNFPDDLIDPVSFEIGLLNDSYTDVIFKNVIDNIQQNDAGGSLKITDNSGTQSQVSSGGNKLVSTNNNNTVETLDRYRLNFSENGINYQQNNWNHELNEYKVKHIFKGWHNNGNQKAYFKQLDKVTINNMLEGILTIGNTEFRDPWYKISENQPNEFQTFTSPFTPGKGNYVSYGGVFLNQGYPSWQPPYYSVRALQTQDINLGGSIGTRKFYFLNWGGSNVQFQNANALETGVVFKDANAVAEANYKGHLFTNSSTATSSNSQRKIKILALADGENKNYFYFTS